MKKQVIISITVCTVFLLSSSRIYSQNQDSKKMVAVLKTGGKSLSDEINGNITVQFEDGVLNSGGYQLLPYSDIYQKAVDAIKQDLVEGTVSVEQLTRLGQAAGADWVYYPIVDKYSDGYFRMAYKLVDVASGKIISIGSKTVRDGTEGLLAAAGSMAQKLFGGDASGSVSQEPVNRTSSNPVDRSGEQKTNNASMVTGVSQNTINKPLTDNTAKNMAPIDGTLNHDVNYSIASVRTWTWFDGNVPSDNKSYEKWSSGNTYTYTIQRFTSDKKVPSGKFVEFLVWIENKGTEDSEIEMINPGDSVLDCQLLYETNQPTTAIAFMLPGVSGAKDQCLINKWKGKLKFNLKSGEKTWLLLLFDVPIDVSEAKLKLKAFTPVPVKIPDVKVKP